MADEKQETSSIVTDLLTLNDPQATPEQKMTVIEKMTTQQLQSKLNGGTIPSELQYIVAMVVQARFNRIGSEGMSSYSENEQSMSFPDDDFTPFYDVIAKFNNKGQTGGMVLFL